jgi:hypothetical protein
MKIVVVSGAFPPAFVLDHPTEAWTMGVAARRVAEERFDIDGMVTQLVDIFLARQ